MVSSGVEPLRAAIAGRVRSIFADPSGRVAPIVPATDGLFPPGSIVRAVHGDVTTMMIGGVAALLVQMLHPLALAGIWDHSNFRTDMAGRLRRTARFIALTTYAGRADAERAIARVRAVHGRVIGTAADGTPYHANDPALLTFVHVAEAECFLAAYRRYRAPVRGADQDSYFAAFAEVARSLGAEAVPVSRAEVASYWTRARPALRVDARTRDAARLVLGQPAPSPALAPMQAVTMAAAVDLLPDWARALHGFPALPLGRPLLRAGAGGLAGVVRWAMAA